MNELQHSIDVWCSTYPRRVTIQQRDAWSASDVYGHISMVNGHGPGYVSVYGFPDGHPTEGEIPAVDTMFIDFDIPSTGEYRSGSGDVEAWKRDMSGLLTRIREVARLLIQLEKDQHWRAALSGHKGVHLYLDFPTIDPKYGSKVQFRIGLEEYANSMVAEMEKQTGMDLSAWVDVDSADLSRLTRLPNTIHDGATASFGERRYCVPVSIRELSVMTPTRYIELTRAPRYVPEACLRSPSTRANTELSNYIKHAPDASGGSAEVTGRVDWASLEEYEKNTLDITVKDLPFVFGPWKCLLYYVDRDDCYDHGDQSHQMKLAVLDKLMNERVPLEVVLEWFDQTPDHNREITTKEFSNLIGYGYLPYSHQKLMRVAPVFADERCPMCQDAKHSNPNILPS